MGSDLLSRPMTRLIVLALGLCFLALAVTRDSSAGIAQALYLASGFVLAVGAHRTWQELTAPSRWAAVSAVGGLAATVIFAATELRIVDSNEWQGVGALVVPAWLFAAVAWFTHAKEIRSLRWVVTLVQVSFTSLSSALFVVLMARSDQLLGTLGYGVASAIGVAASVAAIVGITQRVQVELQRR